MLKGKKVLLGVTGSIAAYKALMLVRLLVKSGAEVKVIMTKAATHFIAPLSFSTLSKNKVLVNLFDEDTWANHVLLGRWADIMIIAPASCNTISKMANGTCNNLLLAIYLSAVCPIVVAPAMDEDMWLHPAPKKNISTLKSFDNIIVPVDNGELASGLSGEGRMAEPEEIIKILEDMFSFEKDLMGKKALVTAGPTYETLDPVRFISNHSSGQMGICLAEELNRRGAEVTLILGPTNLVAGQKINTVKITSASEMYYAALKDIETYDIIIMAAAVADYSPKEKASQKIKKSEKEFSLPLTKTKDILSKVGELKSGKQVLVGFALETQNEKANALLKLSKKNADYMVLNSLNDSGAGFGHSTNKITIFEKNGKEYQFPVKSKKGVAKDIINIITQFKNV